MAITYAIKKYKQNYVLQTMITAVLVFAVFLGMMNYLYTSAEEEGLENLHMQTKQIKDDITRQILSDRENLATMANFAAKLHSDGDSYDLMFESFKPIGLIENIGILTPDNVFVTKTGSMDLNGKISFLEESALGPYISGRVKDLTRDDNELIRTAVPIKVNDEVVGILYGVIRLDKLGTRYSEMAEELNAQLFVYDKATGDLVIDNVHDTLGNISFLKDRQYKEGYSYEQMTVTPNGFTSFMSAYRNENAYLHYSAIDDLGWMIAVARYDSQVFAAAHDMAKVMFITFGVIMLLIVLYAMKLMKNERKINSVTACASDIRKTLLEASGNQLNISDALKLVCDFAMARSAVFFNTDGEVYHYVSTEYTGKPLTADDRKMLMGELFRIANEYYMSTGKILSILRIRPNRHLSKINNELYCFLKNNNIKRISLSATTNNANHVTILAVLNPQHSEKAGILAEKIAACFSMALYNKNYLNKTQLVATTDSLTGALNRVAYKSDMARFDEEKPLDFSCIYVDVNELHTVNNKYGHTAGDEMLIFIANTLKEVFYGYNVYRMGGDEFLVFCQGIGQDAVKKNLENLNQQLDTRGYHVALGVSFRSQNTDTEEMVREAEVRMYEAKAQYYQNKKQHTYEEPTEKEYLQVKTGIMEIDTMISVMKEKYNGIYRVSLDTDKARRILMPAYMQYNENEEHFSELFFKYVVESVDSDYHRAVTSFQNYDAIRHQLADDKIPRITYKKTNGQTVSLSVYKLGDSGDRISDTLWVFAKE